MPNDSVAGPLVTAPEASYLEPWQGQANSVPAQALSHPAVLSSVTTSELQFERAVIAKYRPMAPQQHRYKKEEQAQRGQALHEPQFRQQVKAGHKSDGGGRVLPPVLRAPPGYRAQSEDCSVAADLLDFWLLRQRSPTERLEMGAAMMRGARQMSLEAQQQQHPDLSSEAFAQHIARCWLQEDYPIGYVPSGYEMTWIQDSGSLAAQLHQIFERLNTPYFITGGLAAIAWGEPRTTRDVGIVLAVQPTEIRPVVTALESAGFYVPGVEDVISGRLKTLQITHMETISRADLIIASDEDQALFQRRRSLSFSGTGNLYFASPEDVVLNKLRWGQQSRSEKQWRDVLGILKTQSRLDLVYLRQRAAETDVTDDLERALVEAGVC